MSSHDTTLRPLQTLLRDSISAVGKRPSSSAGSGGSDNRRPFCLAVTAARAARASRVAASFASAAACAALCCHLLLVLARVRLAAEEVTCHGFRCQVHLLGNAKAHMHLPCKLYSGALHIFYSFSCLLPLCVYVYTRAHLGASLANSWVAASGSRL